MELRDRGHSKKRLEGPQQVKPQQGRKQPQVCWYRLCAVRPVCYVFPTNKLTDCAA